MSAASPLVESRFHRETVLGTPQVYKATIALWDTAHQVKGHRLAVMITSDAFPGYARNLNTGEPLINATRMIPAHQTIYHNAMQPSALRFRVLTQNRE